MLLRVVADLNNAADGCHAAAQVLGSIGDLRSLDAMKHLTVDYPEV